MRSSILKRIPEHSIRCLMKWQDKNYAVAGIATESLQIDCIAPGIYIVVIQAVGATETKKMVVR